MEHLSRTLSFTPQRCRALPDSCYRRSGFHCSSVIARCPAGRRPPSLRSAGGRAVLTADARWVPVAPGVTISFEPARPRVEGSRKFMHLTTQPLPSMTADTRVATVPDVTAAAAVFTMVSAESISHGTYSWQPYVTRGAGRKASSRGGLRGGRTSPVRGVRSGSRSDSTINPGRLAYGIHRLPTRRSGSRYEGCGKFGASSTR